MDFYVPGAAQTQKFLTELHRDFSERITFVIRHFPMSDHSRLGAAALEAADRQRCAMPFLEAITQGSAGREKDVPYVSSSATLTSGGVGDPRETGEYADIAGRLGMDEKQFASDMESAATAAMIDADLAEATRAGVTRAPALVLLDGQDHNTLTSLEDFRRAVEVAANP